MDKQNEPKRDRSQYFKKKRKEWYAGLTKEQRDEMNKARWQMMKEKRALEGKPVTEGVGKYVRTKATLEKMSAGKKGKPRRTGGILNTGGPDAMVTEQRPSMPGLDRRWCFFHGTKREREAWMIDRANEIRRLKRIRQFQDATRKGGDWRESWLRDYH